MSVEPPRRIRRQVQPWSADDFEPIAAFLVHQLALEMPPHRLQLLQARLQCRLQTDGFASFGRFHDRLMHLETRNIAAQLLIDLSTINHTSFFREPAPLRILANQLARQLQVETRPVRVWSAGCSMGQEPFSFLMILAEVLGEVPPDRVLIWASDLSLGALQIAARAVYDEKQIGRISADRLHRFFLKGRGSQAGWYRIVPELRRLVTFCHLDLRRTNWTVPGEFDAILLRNVAIYFEETERLRLIDRLAEHLAPGGWLVVGQGEIVPDRPGLLWKQAPSLFRRVDRP